MESYDGMGGWNPNELLATSELLSEVQEYDLDNYSQELETAFPKSSSKLHAGPWLGRRVSPIGG